MPKTDTAAKVGQYVATWLKRGYEDGIPDDVPAELMPDNLAPSYKAICIAILKNDVGLISLGFAPEVKASYVALKQIEIAARIPRTATTECEQEQLL